MSQPEHMQFRYQEGNRYVDADEVVDWGAVSAGEIELLVRAECPEGGFSNSRAFAMGDLADAYGPADRYRRQLFSAVVALRN